MVNEPNYVLVAEAERDELVRLRAAATRVRALAEAWASDPGWGEIFFNDAAAAILAALDGTDNAGEPTPATRRPEGRSDEDSPAVRRIDFDDPPCGVCGCMNHSCSAYCDCCPEHDEPEGSHG